jgi:endo-alpha-1,4-polygalactosaminidase (GH114 family)
MSTGTGTDLDSDELTLANVKDGTIKYKTLRKDKLQLLCGTLLDHIKDYEAKFMEAYVQEAKAKAKANGKIDQIISVQRAEIEELKDAVLVSNASNVKLRVKLKEAKVEKAKVELESEGDVFFLDNGTGHRE